MDQSFYSIHDHYISHHGIKGQKWGVRRWRNEDGTLTEAGKRRYEKLLKKYTVTDKNGDVRLNDKKVTRKERALVATSAAGAVAAGAAAHRQSAWGETAQVLFQTGNAGDAMIAGGNARTFRRMKRAALAVPVASTIALYKTESDLTFLNKYAKSYGGKSLNKLRSDTYKYTPEAIRLRGSYKAQVAGAGGYFFGRSR